jgi:hypothetical protein
MDAIEGAFKGKNLLFGTPVAMVADTLPGGLNKGDTIKVPYFGTLGEMEDIINEGDALTPEKLSESVEEAKVRHSGKAFERTEWTRLAAAQDPYPEAARQFAIIARRRADKGLIDVATAPGLPSEYTNDISAEGDGTINYDHLVDTVGAWEDEQEGIRLLGVHPKVLRDLLKLKDGMQRPLLVMPTTDNTVPMFMGIPVYVSSKCKRIEIAPGEFRYETLIIKEAALAFWFQSRPRVLTDVDALADSELAAIHMYWVAHRYKRVRGSTHPGVLKLITK